MEYYRKPAKYVKSRGTELTLSSSLDVRQEACLALAGAHYAHVRCISQKKKFKQYKFKEIIWSSCLMNVLAQRLTKKKEYIKDEQLTIIQKQNSTRRERIETTRDHQMAKEVSNAKCICISLSTYVYLFPLASVKEHFCIYPTWVYVYEYVT